MAQLMQSNYNQHFYVSGQLSGRG